MIRTPIQITTIVERKGVELYALCGDGTIWRYSATEWKELPFVPQTQSEFLKVK